MKIKIIIIICISIINTNPFFAQEKNICGEVYYKQIYKSPKTNISDFLLTFDNKQSYSKEINIKYSSDSQETKNSEKGSTKTTIIGRENTIPMFFYNNKKEFYFRDIFLNKALLVKENSFEWKWNLHSETKKIGQLICQKATIDFRGRSYTAWFTNKIPVPFGPWKFQGLSGLILEVYDTDKIFHIIVSKIKVGKTVDCSINIDKTQFSKAITITKYNDKREELINAFLAKLSSKMPKGSKPLKWDKNCNDCSEKLEIFDEEK